MDESKFLINYISEESFSKLTDYFWQFSQWKHEKLYEKEYHETYFRQFGFIITIIKTLLHLTQKYCLIQPVMKTPSYPAMSLKYRKVFLYQSRVIKRYLKIAELKEALFRNMVFVQKDIPSRLSKNYWSILYGSVSYSSWERSLNKWINYDSIRPRIYFDMRSSHQWL